MKGAPSNAPKNLPWSILVMAKPVKLPKYLQGKNPKPLIEVFEDFKPIDPLNLIESLTAFAIEESVRLNLKKKNSLGTAP